MISFVSIENGEALELPAGLKVNLNLRNPVFDPQSIDRVWTLPFRVPTTDRNKEMLGYANRLDHYQAPKKKIPAFFYLDGIPFRRGTLEVKKANQDNFELVFQEDTLALATRLGEQRLRSLNIPIEVADPFCTGIEMTADRISFIGEAPYITTTINGQFFSRPFEEYLLFLEDIEAIFPNLLEFVAFEDERLVVFKFVCRPDLNTFEFASHTQAPPPEGGRWVPLVPSGSIPDQIEAERLITAYKAYLQTDPEAWRAPTIYAPDFFDEKNPEHAGYMNVYDPDAEEYLFENHFSNPPDNPQPGWRTSLLPLPRIAYLIEQIALSQQLQGLDGLLADNEELAELLLWQNRALDELTIGHIPRIITITGELFLEGFEFLFFPGIWNLGEYCPDITAMELLERLSSTFGWILDVYQEKIRFRSIRSILTAPPKDITEQVSPTYTLTLDEKTGFLLTFERVEDEFRVPGQLEDIAVGEKSTDYVSGFSSLAEITRPVGFTYDNETQTLPTRSLRVPGTNEVGANAYYALNNAPSLKLLFWRGFVRDAVSTQTYPYASHSDRDLLGNQIGNFSLDWAGKNGRFEKWWKEYIALEQHGRTDKRLLYLSIADLIELSDWSSSRVTYYTPQGSAVGIIESIRVQLSTDSPSVTVGEVTIRLEK